MKTMLHILAVFAISLFPFSAIATESRTDTGQSTVVELENLDEKLKLAEQIHKFVPVSERINNAIDAVSARLPEAQRDAFRTAMRGVLNYLVIEKMSVDTMAETFTMEELEFMLAYHQNPLSESVDAKYETYEQKMQPEITRMLDRAMMRVRTGGTLDP